MDDLTKQSLEERNSRGFVPDRSAELTQETLDHIITTTEMNIDWGKWPRELTLPVIEESGSDILFTFQDGEGKAYQATITPGDIDDPIGGEDFMEWVDDVEKTSKWPHDGSVIDYAFLAAGVVRTRRIELDDRGFEGDLPVQLLEVGQSAEREARLINEVMNPIGTLGPKVKTPNVQVGDTVETTERMQSNVGGVLLVKVESKTGVVARINSNSTMISTGGAIIGNLDSHNGDSYVVRRVVPEKQPAGERGLGVKINARGPVKPNVETAPPVPPPPGVGGMGI